MTVRIQRVPQRPLGTVALSGPGPAASFLVRHPSGEQRRSDRLVLISAPPVGDRASGHFSRICSTWARPSETKTSARRWNAVGPPCTCSPASARSAVCTSSASCTRPTARSASPWRCRTTDCTDQYLNPADSPAARSTIGRAVVTSPSPWSDATEQRAILRGPRAAVVCWCGTISSTRREPPARSTSGRRGRPREARPWTGRHRSRAGRCWHRTAAVEPATPR
jgi:hypothetical protein